MIGFVTGPPRKNSMTDRAYMGGAEPSLVEIYQEMSELLDKQVNAQKEKNLGGCAISHKPTKKCAILGPP